MRAIHEISLDKVKDRVKEEGFECFKYIRVNGQYRFCVLYNSHPDLLDEGEVAESAGFVRINRSDVKISDHSMLLKLWPCDADYEELPKLFDKPLHKEEW